MTLDTVTNLLCMFLLCYKQSLAFGHEISKGIAAYLGTKMVYFYGLIFFLCVTFDRSGKFLLLSSLLHLQTLSQSGHVYVLCRYNIMMLLYQALGSL